MGPTVSAKRGRKKQTVLFLRKGNNAEKDKLHSGLHLLVKPTSHPFLCPKEESLPMHCTGITPKQTKTPSSSTSLSLELRFTASHLPD